MRGSPFVWLVRTFCVYIFGFVLHAQEAPKDDWVVAAYPYTQQHLKGMGIEIPNADHAVDDDAVDAFVRSNSSQQAVDAGQAFVEKMRFFLPELPAKTSAVSFPRELLVRTTRAGHQMLRRIETSGKSAQLGLVLSELNTTFVAFDLVDIQSHEEFRKRASLSQGALLELWREGKGSVLAQQKIIAPNGVNSQAEGVEELIYREGDPTAPNEQGLVTREVGSIFNATALYDLRRNVFEVTMTPELAMSVPPPSVPAKNASVTNRLAWSPTFTSYNLTSMVKIAPGATLVQGGAWLVAGGDAPDRMVYAFTNADLLDLAHKQIDPNTYAPPGIVTNEAGFVVEQLRGPKVWEVDDLSLVLKALGMPFPKGASARRSGQGWTVVNRPEHMQLLAPFREPGPQQVEVDASIVRFPMEVLRADPQFAARGAASPEALIRLWQTGRGRLLRTMKVISTHGIMAQAEGVHELMYETQESPSSTNRVYEVREVGMILNVTPQVHRQTIQLTVISEFAQLDRWINIPNTPAQPVFQSQNSESSISLKTGAMTVLGGNLSPGPEKAQLEVLFIRAELIDGRGRAVGLKREDGR